MQRFNASQFIEINSLLKWQRVIIEDFATFAADIYLFDVYHITYA